MFSFLRKPVTPPPRNDAAPDDVAIIGLALRLPQSDTLEQFWSNLVEQKSSITEVPAQRWSKDDYYGDPRRFDGKTNSIWGGFVEHADCFDAEFFRISPREAQNMDPQQRFAMELSWQAIEDAGYRPSQFAGSNTGVYMGVCHWDYAELFEQTGQKVDAYFPTGTAYSIIANRISHYFDLAGPSLINDTACASSLVSVYQAVRAIQNGEVEAALAGGVNLCWSVNHFIAFSKNGMLSRDGRCKAFDGSADGYVRGEGGAVLLLKSLRSALRDGDSIHAVIKGIGTNHGGRTNSLTVTNPRAQARLITQIYAAAGVPPASVSYIEAHGPGTPLGDPVEVLGLKLAFQELHQRFGSAMRPASCGIGSVKTNIGHLEGAAGVAGMLKVVAAMRHRTLPANVHFTRLNPMIKLDDSPFYVVAESVPWQPDGIRRAGVSSFGFGGSNAHVLLEEFIAPAVTVAAPADAPVLVPLSARDPERLRVLAQALSAELQARPAVELAALACTLQLGREAMAERVVFAVSELPELVGKLEAWLAGKPAIAACWGGNSSQGGRLVSLLTDDDAYRSLLRQWIADRQLAKIGEFWAHGAAIEWELFYPAGKPRKLHLPTYPFARVRHWFPDPVGGVGVAQVERLHPLLHQNISTLREQAYSVRFSGREFFLADHHVAQEMVLPGVVYLEMVRAALTLALEQAEPLLLKNVVWTRPLVLADGPVDLRLSLTPQADGELAYAASSGSGEQSQVYSQGRVTRGDSARPAALDLARLRAECPDSVTPAACYGMLGAAGIEHGASLQGLQTLHVGERQVLAELRLPAGLAPAAAEYVLHPSLLDSAIQATVALLRGEGPALPFALRELRVDAPCTLQMWAWVRYSDSASPMPTFDIDLCDGQGQVCVRMAGLALRRLETATATPRSEPELLYSRNEWQDQPRLPGDIDAAQTLSVFVALSDPQRIAALGEQLGDAHVEALPLAADSLEAATLAVLRHLQTRLGEHRKTLVCIVVPDTEQGHLLTPLLALLKTARLESSRIDGKLMRVAGLAAMRAGPLAELIGAESRAFGQHVRIDPQGRRQVRLQVELAVAAPTAPVFREGGVYWITGGGGGLGQIVARELARAGDVRLVLSGRSGAPAHDLAVDYFAADVSDAADVRRVVAAIIDKYGVLNGVIHCAGVLDDAFIANKSERQVAAVFAPKVSGVQHIDHATRDIGLDFLLLFSSVAAVHGGAGQADYSVANAFLDAYAEQRQDRARAGQCSGRTIAINWPLWADGGMRMPAAGIAAMRRRGMLPLPTESGLSALAAILASGHGGAIALAYGQGDALRRDLRAESEPPAPAAAVVPVDVPGLEARTMTLLKTILGRVLKLDPQKIRPKEKFEQYGFDSIMAVDMILQLEELLGSLPKTLFFEYVDLQGVAGYLIEEHRAALVASLDPQSAVADVGPAPAAGIANRFVASLPTRHDSGDAPDYHDIAVIGLAGRYPRAETMEQFWEVLSSGQHCFEKIPSERWRHAGIYHDQRDILGKTTIRNGSFLSDIDRFDPRYFNISQRDAELMSPEVRLFLQVGVEAFEDAGYSREEMHQRFDGDVGVLVGTMSNHYGLYGFQNMLVRGARANGSYTGTLPNMLSYFYGFSGPSIFMDTMCSAAATCIDQGVHMLRSRQCRMVLAGGVNLLLHPYNFISSSQEHFTTRTSELIRSYGQGADGTILGEGVGAVLLKPLVDAVRDRDHIYGVIKGTAINNAGVRNGFTVPSPAMQARAVDKALRDAAVDPRSISYVEGHGSGTKLGDPIEIKALTQAYRSYTEARQFCPIGSVKSNIAHLLAAAGVAGFTKVLLQLKHRQIVPSLHAEELNPDIPFADSPFYVQRELSGWERPKVDGQVYPRRAGVTSIGAGGMNSHIIVEEYSATLAPRLPSQPRMVVVSAGNRSLLLSYLERLRGYLERHPDCDLASLSYTLQVGRNALPCRLAVVVADAAALLRAMADFARDGVADGLCHGDNIVTGNQEFDDADIERVLDAASLERIADYWVRGAAIDWDRLWGTQLPYRISLPTCPFEKIRCWYAVDADAPTVENPLSSQRKWHPFIGRNVSDLASVRYETDFRISELLDYAFHHGTRRQILPSFVIDTALALAGIAGVRGEFVVADLKWHQAGDWEAVATLHIAIAAATDGTHAAQIAWQGPDDAPRLLAEWQLRPALLSPAPAQLPAAQQTIDGADFYRELQEGGLDYAPYLEGVHQLSLLDGGACLATLQAPLLRQDHYPSNVRIEPYVLGALVQVAQYLAKREGRSDWAGYAPLDIGELALLPGQVTQVLLHGLRGRADLLASDATILGRISGIRFGNAAADATPLAAVTVAVPDDESALIRADLVAQIRAHMSAILKFPLADIDTRTPFYNFGFDSISMTELAGKISVEFGLSLTPALFFEVENAEQLVGHMLGAHPLKLQDRWRRKHLRQRPGAAPPGVAAAGLAGSRALARSPAGPGLPIAIVGAAGRFPGADNLDAFWDQLAAGYNAIGPLPMSRYGEAYQELVRQADFPKRAGILHDIDRFDAAFFNISPTEAELMDPQHRLFLETVWSALEHAGYRPATLPASTGVYVGVSATDYATLLAAHAVPADAYTSTGTAHSMLANRVSFFLDVHGPSQAIDTACSSSLVALHRAVESIRSGQCAMAIAGGVNVALTTDTFVGAHMAGMLSPDGQCQTFSARANGYVRGEGVAALVLKPLLQAERDGDAILGVLLGSAENHGGRAHSLTAPNARAQAELVERAMRGIDPCSISYIETHGTGTSLGDPVEINGLKLAFARLHAERGGAASGQRCGLGSVKSNIGHLEAAAGIAGVVKVLLAMRHRLLPASLHCDPLNPYIDLAGSPFHIVSAACAWEAPAPRRAGVSSFGFGGANAHVVLEEYPLRPTSPPGTPGPWLVVLSARSDERLRAVVGNLCRWIEGAAPAADLLERIAYTLQVGREPMSERLALAAGSPEELCHRLRAFLDCRADAAQVLRGSVKRPDGGPALPAEGDPQALLQRWIAGCDIAWDGLYRQQPRRIALPTYPFAPDRYWIPTVAPEVDVARLLDAVLDDVVSVDAAIDALRRAGYGQSEQI